MQLPNEAHTCFELNINDKSYWRSGRTTRMLEAYRKLTVDGIQCTIVTFSASQKKTFIKENIPAEDIIVFSNTSPNCIKILFDDSYLIDHEVAWTLIKQLWKHWARFNK